MTDEQLETLLRETFASREALADPDVAQEVARSVHAPARRWPTYAAVAAAVLVVALLGTVLVGNRTTEPSVTRPQPPPPASTATYQENRATALAEAERLVRLVPLPSSAVEADRALWPGEGFGIGPSDPELRQTVVWTVPQEAEAVGQHLRDHTIDGATAVGGATSQSIGGPIVRELDYTVPSRTPEATTDTTVSVQWVQDGDRTLVRADTFLAARAVRTASTYVAGDVTAVDIDRVVPRPPDNQRLAPVHLTAPGDSADITRLVNALNGLPASIKPAFNASCPYPGKSPPFVTLTFHTTEETVVAHLETACWGQVQVSRDGAQVRPTLDPGDLTEAVESAVGRR
jgi:hypothetical protein